MTRRSDSVKSEEVPLTGVAAEFRTALREEIEAARRSPSSGDVSLINGRRIAQVGAGYQYVFDVENVLNRPADMPGDLFVDGRKFDVDLISVDGLTITLSVSKDLGAFVPNARLRTDLTLLLRRLIERIEAWADRPNPAGDLILGRAPISGGPASLHLSEHKLNCQQRDAVASSLGRNATFIWGPPGTGKTTTIGAIAEQFYRDRRSALLVSHTNIAVDQAVIKIADALDPSELENGVVVRVGDPRDPRLLTDEYREVRLKTHVDRRSAQLAQRREALNLQYEVAAREVIALSRKIEICDWLAEAPDDLVSMTQELERIRSLEAKLRQVRSHHLDLAASSEKWARAAEAAREAKRAIGMRAPLRERISEMKQLLSTLREQQAERDALLAEAQALYAETASVGTLRRLWRRLPAPEAQQQVAETTRARVEETQRELSEARRRLEQARAQERSSSAEIERFGREYSDSPNEVLRQADAHASELAQLGLSAEQLTTQAAEARLELEDLLRTRLAVLKEWHLTSEPPGSAEPMLAAIRTAYDCALAEVQSDDLHELRAERSRLNEQIRALDSEIKTIEEALKRVEQLVIADAMVVATTLTRAYLRDDIQSRRFDTVILDEASIAPIPALWVAASLADANAIVVGDSKQLPPIVLSNNELARHWLGRDIFEAADLASYAADAPHLVRLRRQYRMHPDISAVPNELIYDGMLRDDDKTKDDGDLTRWYQGHDDAVLLVDTGPLGAWVTGVPRGRGASRLNFLSATVCVDLAQQLLAQHREEWKRQEPARVLIICPYHAHAALLKRLLEEEKLWGEVLAGTVHSFQGSEADVVIFDLVNDEPHRLVGMFSPAYDKNAKRLLNVALTRARRRLIIVGDFDYILKTANKNCFLRAQLIPLVCDRYPRRNALDTVPSGLAARAAHAQLSAVGGEVEPDAARLVLTQDQGALRHFYPILCGDLRRAKRQIVIYSAFMTQSRLAMLEAHLRAAVEDGKKLYVVTKPLCERRKAEVSQYRMLEQALADWGLVVIHKRNMHEKLVFIDDNILWEGSLNPLSFTGETGEHIERRDSRKVFSDYARGNRLDDLVGAYDEGHSACPVCQSEMLAAEGRDARGFPFYWRCVNPDCDYSRDIDTPPPTGGLINCANCGAEVQYGEWGSKPAWRCVENRRHHQRLAPAHLRLPKMRNLLHPGELRRLERQFGISQAGDKRSVLKQPGLFGSPRN